MDVSPQKAEELNALFESACSAHTSQQLTKAIDLYRQILEFAPAPLVFYNLGLAYYELEKYQDALIAFQHAHAGDPADMDTIFNLALAHKACGDLEAAIDAFLHFLTSEDSNIDALYNLAGCYREKREDQEAIRLYLKVLQLSPKHLSALNNIAYTSMLTGDSESAGKYYRKLLTLNPEHEAAGHMLAAIEGRTPDRPPESYIVDIFDNYSANYEQSLVNNLQYNGPQMLRRLLDSVTGPQHQFIRALDLGCGTGLAGIEFSPISKELTGVDLSAKMIELARGKMVYSMLETANIIEFLQTTNALYDLFIAADVLNYIGGLEELFEHLTRVSMKDCRFCFSTEFTAEKSYTLCKTGRYAHSPEYINRVASSYGWLTEKAEEAELRKDKGNWVKGNIWVMSRSEN